MVLAGLMARDLGGSRWAQVVAALATAIAPMSLALGALFEYTSFDYLWWVLIAYLMIRLLKSDNPRWWLALGGAIGLGLMTKYTIVFCVAGIAVGLLFTRSRRHLLSPWLWAGAALALLIVLPNLIWQIQHDFVALSFTSQIHARDVRMGRADGYLVEQLFLCANAVTIPLWVAGLYFYFVSPSGRRFRPLGWMFVVPFALFLVTQARAYYQAPAYPLLLSGGAVLVERWLGSLTALWARRVRRTGWGLLLIGGLSAAAVSLPVAPVGSSWYDIAAAANDGLRDEIGWAELTELVAGVYSALPPEERAQTGILAGNYGEAGAINLYGPALGLPQAISGVNSYWLRGYSDPPPQTLIVLGIPRQRAEQLFETCDQAGRITNRFGIENDETLYNPEVLVCRRLRQSWPEFWQRFRSFG